MHMLYVRYHAREEGYAFTSSEDAYSALSALNSKIGKRWYGKNGDDENPTHVIRTPSGEAAICLEKVESVSVVDLDKDTALAEELFQRSLKVSTQRKANLRKAELEAGLSGLPVVA